MESATQLCLVVLFVTTFVNEALGAKDKELYCGGKFQKIIPLPSRSEHQLSQLMTIC